MPSWAAFDPRDEAASPINDPGSLDPTRLKTRIGGTLRPIRQDEAEQMRDSLKRIASFYNPSLEHDSGQAAALAARETLEKLGLLSQKDAKGHAKGSTQASGAS